MHNGSLSNPYSLRRLLEEENLEFETDNDSEAACRFLQWRMRKGDTIEQALSAALGKDRRLLYFPDRNGPRAGPGAGRLRLQAGGGGGDRPIRRDIFRVPIRWRTCLESRRPIFSNRFPTDLCLEVRGVKPVRFDLSVTSVRELNDYLHHRLDRRRRASGRDPESQRHAQYRGRPGLSGRGAHAGQCRLLRRRHEQAGSNQRVRQRGLERGREHHVGQSCASGATLRSARRPRATAAWS